MISNDDALSPGHSIKSVQTLPVSAPHFDCHQAYCFPKITSQCPKCINLHVLLQAFAVLLHGAMQRRRRLARLSGVQVLNAQIQAGPRAAGLDGPWAAAHVSEARPRQKSCWIAVTAEQLLTCGECYGRPALQLEHHPPGRLPSCSSADTLPTSLGLGLAQPPGNAVGLLSSCPGLLLHYLPARITASEKTANKLQMGRLQRRISRMASENVPQNARAAFLMPWQSQACSSNTNEDGSTTVAWESDEVHLESMDFT